MSAPVHIGELLAHVAAEDDRTLGPAMIAEGWMVVGGEWIMWCHEASHQVVALENYRWSQCRGIPAYQGEPADPDAEGYVVRCYVAADNGEPTSRGWSTWFASYGLALRVAQHTRASILRGAS